MIGSRSIGGALATDARQGNRGFRDLQPGGEWG